MVAQRTDMRALAWHKVKLTSARTPTRARSRPQSRSDQHRGSSTRRSPRSPRDPAAQWQEHEREQTARHARGRNVSNPHLLDGLDDVLPVQVDLGFVELDINRGQPLLQGDEAVEHAQ